MNPDEIPPLLADLCRQVGALLGPALQPRIAEAAGSLEEPLRLAVAGRVKAGKSTLVNALVGRRVAPTKAGECTRVVTWYRYGAPDRAEVRLRTGEVRDLPLIAGMLPEDPGLPVNEIDKIVVYLQSAPLRTKTLIDTPGLATLTGEYQEQTRRTLLGEDADSQHATGQADAVLFVFREAERLDEVEFLRQFHSASGELSATAVNAVGVLAQADLFGSGLDDEDDPFDIAAEQARRLAKARISEVGGVIPVSGLMAEAARTGRVREAEATLLSRLAAVDVMDLRLREVLGPPEGFEARSLDRLYTLLGTYGVHVGRRHADSGAGQLVRWLDERSGVAELETWVTRRLVRRSLPLKVMRVLATVTRTAQSQGSDEALSLIEDFKLHPAMHGLRELRALQLLVGQVPDSALREQLDRVVDSASLPEMLGLEPHADVAAQLAAARELTAAAQADATLSAWPAEVEAARVLARTYQIAAHRAGSSG